MDNFSYYMPTKLFVGTLPEFAGEFLGFGQKAYIVTGHSSARNGSLKDVCDILNNAKIDFAIFNEVEENPSLETVDIAALKGLEEKVDFIIAIGGGSPMDAAKGIAAVIANPNLKCVDLYDLGAVKTLPLICVPTTAGTGSEATPYSVLTNHAKKTKVSLPQSIFPVKAFLDERYTENLPDSITYATALDAFAHLAEGYLATKANYLSDRLAESGIIAFGECIPFLCKREFAPIRQKLLVISSIGGMVISQTKTSLPHQLGYALTYNKQMPHGLACASLMGEYFRLHKNQNKVNKILQMLCFENLTEFKNFISENIEIPATISEHECLEYAETIFQAPNRLANHPFSVTLQDIKDIYINSLVR